MIVFPAPRWALGHPPCSKPARGPGTPLQRPASCRRTSRSGAANPSFSDSPSHLESVLSAPTPQLILDGCARVWPGWARAGFRLLTPGGGTPVADVPTPQQAAALLKAVAKRTLKLLAKERALSLARDRVVLGLVEGLRAAPPRGAAGPAATVHLTWVPKAPQGSAPAAGGGAAAAAEGSAAAVAEAGPAAGLPPVALGARELGPKGLSGALWSLVVLGGDVEYQAEMEGLLTLLPWVQFGSLQQVADVCWALGTARHWTPHLSLLEQQAVRLIEAALEEPTSAAPPAAAARGFIESKGRREVRAALDEPTDMPPPAAAAEGPKNSKGGRLTDSIGGGNGSLCGGSSTGSNAGSSTGRRGVVGSSQVAGTAWGLAALGHAPLSLLGLLPTLLRHWEAESQGGADGGSSGQARQAKGQGRQEQQRGGGQMAGQASRRSGASFSSLCTLAWAVAASGQLQGKKPLTQPCISLLAAVARSAAAAEQASRSSTSKAVALGAAAGAGPGAQRAQRDGARTAAYTADPSSKQLMQLQQVALALGPLCHEEGREGGHDEGRHWLEQLPPEEAACLQLLFARAAEAAGSFARDGRNQKVSACQADVAYTLSSLGFVPQQEYQVAPGLVVDAAVPSLKLAVEVDGPSHFTRNLAPKEGPPIGSEAASGYVRLPVGATLLKHRLIKEAGWRVAQVEAAAWEQLRGPAQKRQALQAAIAAAGGGGLMDGGMLDNEGDE